ncbi:MAG: hypothetical protein K6E47_05895 [Lachnospiraceae bacterium]|nr:hypothetical protein [Lachnospiraceae bacterium]
MTELVQVFCSFGFPLFDLVTIAYLAIAVAWVITVKRRVTFSFIKGYLVMGGVVIIMLFILRLMRWDFFEKVFVVGRYVWYSYYIPITALSLFSFLLALRVGREAEKRNKAFDFISIISWLVIVIFVMTNDFHKLVFKIESYNNVIISYSYNIGYYVVLLWCMVFTASSVIIMVFRCRNSYAKKLVWIPVGICLLSSALLFMYAINGGNSPEINGTKLYNVQEVYAIMYIGMWEAMLRIGLIPSNSDYDDIFKLANVKAAIVDDNNNLKYMSNEAIELDPVEIVRAKRENGLKLDENRRVKSKNLETGSVLWIEDLTGVNELNANLKEAIERAQEENSLLEIENDLKAEKQAVDVRNRLYDSISQRTRSQLEKIERIIEKAEVLNEDRVTAIKRCAVLGAFIKRQANLSILAEQYKMLKLEELRFAIRESLENVKLLGVDANVSGIKADTEFDGGLLIFVYEIFEAVLEEAFPGVETISCILLGNEGIKLEMLMDTPAGLPDFSKFDLERYGAAIEVLHEEEGVYVRLRSHGDSRFIRQASRFNEESGVST